MFCAQRGTTWRYVRLRLKCPQKRQIIQHNLKNKELTSDKLLYNNWRGISFDNSSYLICLDRGGGGGGGGGAKHARGGAVKYVKS